MTKSAGRAPAPPKAKGTQQGHFAKPGVGAGRFVGLDTASAPGSGFLAKTRLKKSGGSLVMTVPAAARNLLNLVDGQEMIVTVDGSKVVIEPAMTETLPRLRRPKYTLDELVDGMNPEAPLTDEERAWMDEPAAGRETW